MNYITLTLIIFLMLLICASIIYIYKLQQATKTSESDALATLSANKTWLLCGLILAGTGIMSGFTGSSCSGCSV